MISNRCIQHSPKTPNKWHDCVCTSYNLSVKAIEYHEHDPFTYAEFLCRADHLCNSRLQDPGISIPSTDQLFLAHPVGKEPEEPTRSKVRPAREREEQLASLAQIQIPAY